MLANFTPAFSRQILSAAINNCRGLKGTVDGIISNRKYDKDEIAPYYVEWHKKFSLSVIIVLLFLISAPLGAIIRKGGIGMPLVISVVLFVLFYAINMVGEKIGKEGIVPIWVGMWMSSLVLLPIGLFITYKATKDSTVFNFSATAWIVKKIKQLFKKKSAILIAAAQNDVAENKEKIT